MRSSRAYLLATAISLLPAGAGPALAARTERVNLGSAGRQDGEGTNLGSLSYGGRYVAFPGSDGLADGDRNGVPDVLVRDRKAGTASLASVGTAGAQGNAVSGDCRMARDARRVAFRSLA